MNVLIAEDSVITAEHLKSIMESFGHKVIGLARDKNTILEFLKNTIPDIILLDIEMENKYDGIEIGEFIFQNYNFPIIYITAHSDTKTVKKALKTKPSGYILKPFNEIDVFTTFNIALEKAKKVKDKKYVLLKKGKTTEKLMIEDILYIRSDNNYIDIFTNYKRYTERTSIDTFLELLNSNNLLRVHRSYVINKDFATKFDKKRVFIGNIEIPVSRANCNEVKKLFTE